MPHQPQTLVLGRLVSAAALTNLADGMGQLALPWLASLFTRDPILIAAVMFSQRLPWLVLAIPFGVLTDRYNRGRIIVASDALRAMLTVLILLIALAMLPALEGETNVVMLGAIYLIAIGLGAAEVFRDNAAQTILPQIVPAGSLEKANGRIWSVEQVAGSLIGPMLAGTLISASILWPFLLSASAFALATVLMVGLRAPNPRRSEVLNLKRDSLLGWRWMRRHKTILRLAIMLGLMNAMAAMMMAMLILFSQDVLGLDAFQHGLIMTMGALGGVIGGLAGADIVDKVGRQRGVLIALGTFPLTYSVIGAANGLLMAGLAFAVSTVASVIWNVITVSYRQRLIPARLLGRVNSMYRFFAWGMIPIGALAGGLVVALAEPALGREMAIRLPFFIAAAGSAGIFAYGLMKLRL